MKKSEFTLPSNDGITDLHCILWEPETEPKALFQLVHGMCEYIDRYSEFAEYLTERGIVVLGHDHLGHGDSVTDKQKYGFFAEKDGARIVIDDMRTVTLYGKTRFPGIPNFILGHSMGSFMVRRYLTIYGRDVNGAVIMGTGMVPGIVAGLGKAVAGALKGFCGGLYRSKLVTNMAIGGYNKLFEPCRTSSDWLSRNTENVDKYEADDRCGFMFTVSAYKDFFTVMGLIAKESVYTKTPRELPVLITSGAVDPVGGTAAVEALEKQYKGIGMTNVTTRIYPEDRHEILNEVDREQVYADIWFWLKGAMQK